ncbi:MAG: haloacid dehalogenase type II [Gammaproteobacteria bacterium]|nr:haloacid dehalogenase type II [Gammaproteobacteria bacterium]MYD75278.1 haloacid dehalogenase type II [Gammaproteobacteria bacterium]MYJ51119.1 haloacid dehalogenase type II [Gammaproteobacteria bacterium]
MKQVLGFDVYGTLIDTHGVITLLETMIGESAPRFSMAWREKQLEYTFRRGLMGRYRNFGICTRDALEHTARSLGHSLTETQKEELITAYGTLPAFPDAVAGLEAVKATGQAMHAFSNGQLHAVDRVLVNAGIRDYFGDTVSVDTVGTFKPSPQTYRHFMDSTGCGPGNAWLVSSNGFDVIGAAAMGMNTIWIRRDDRLVLDPWEFRPTAVLDSLERIVEVIGV